MGAMTAALGRGPKLSDDPERLVGDEFVMGSLVQFEASPEGCRRREADDALATLLMAGVDPRNLHGRF